ncbi:MAG: hypothetical protein HQ568_08655 [Calditrichaeota bacterium]|nr:hypothetical protein [Calditrichota bacterium]
MFFRQVRTPDGTLFIQRIDLKIQWENSKSRSEPQAETSSGNKLQIEKISVSHTASETYIKLEDRVIILPPSAMKKLYLNLKDAVSEWEAEHGKIKAPKGKTRKGDLTPTKVLKALYKSRKIGSKLVSINTGKRKHLPLKGK